MKRAQLVTSLLLVLAVQTAAKADPQSVNATAHVISLVFVDGGIEQRRERKPFDTLKTCHAWKHQRDFLPPQPASLVSFVYCEPAEAAPTRTAGMPRLARTSPLLPRGAFGPV